MSNLSYNSYLSYLSYNSYRQKNVCIIGKIILIAGFILERGLAGSPQFGKNAA